MLPTNKLSGAENVVADIIMMFNEEIDMAYTSPKGEISKSLDDRNIKFFPLEKFNYQNVRKVIEKFQPDVIHAHDFKSSILTAHMLNNKIPVIAHLHSNSEDLKHYNLKTILFLFALKKISKIITVSSGIMNEYVFRKYVDLSKVETLVNVLYEPRIHYLMNKDTSIYNFDFVYVGRLEHPKNPKRIAEVASIVLKTNNSLKFGVVGNGTLMNEMVSVFEDNGVSNQVTFTGNLAYPYKVLGSSKALLMCSIFEGTPITVLEAMSMGVPVVSTPVSGIMEMLPNSTLFSDKNKVLASYVLQLINDNEFRLLESQKVKISFKQNNNVEQYKSQLHKIYQSVLSNHN